MGGETGSYRIAGGVGEGIGEEEEGRNSVRSHALGKSFLGEAPSSIKKDLQGVREIYPRRKGGIDQKSGKKKKFAASRKR